MTEPNEVEKWIAATARSLEDALRRAYEKGKADGIDIGLGDQKIICMGHVADAEKELRDRVREWAKAKLADKPSAGACYALENLLAFLDGKEGA